jgi:hypothetical protein
MIKTKIIFSCLYLFNILFATGVINLSENNYINFQTDNPEKVIIDLQIGKIEYSIISKENENFIKLQVLNSYNSNEIGAPELPQINNLIEIPYGSQPYIEVITDEFVEFDLNQIAPNLKLFPAQPSVRKTEDIVNMDFFFDKAMYNDDKYIKYDLASVVEKGKMRELNIGNLMISPIEYNPIKNKIIIHKNIQLVVHFENINYQLDEEIKQKYSSQYFEHIYSQSLINYNNTRDRENDFMQDQVTYLIIANQSFSGYLNDFIDWKKQKGFNVITAYTNEIGSTASSIRAYIQEQYTNPLDNMAPISFVLLVGDTQQIPASFDTGAHVSDLDYCDMGNDNIPDILCGRFSAQTPNQLLSQINKTLEYEQYLMPDPSYLEDVILISGVDASYAPTYGNGQINYGNQYYFNSSHNINSQTFLYPESGSSGSQILNLANQGASFMNYTAHGLETGWDDPEFDVNDVNNMTNYQKYATMMGNTCLTNAFDTGECFGEALLRIENAGAVGYIGGSDYTYWNEDFWFGVGSGSIGVNPDYGSTGEGAYDGMFHENNENNWAVVNSAIIMLGNLAVMEANGMEDYYWEIYHLMGDPSLSTYLGVPNPNVIEHPFFVSPGSSNITINAEPFSYVGLTKDNILIGSGMVNEFGVADIALSNMGSTGEILVTVTGQSLQPYFGSMILSAPNGPYVTVDSISLNDGVDNIISVGETFSLDITLENLGSSSAYNTILEIEEITSSPYISVLNGYQIINELEDGDSNNTNFEINVLDSAPYGHSFSIEISLISEENTYQNTLELSLEKLTESFESGDFNSMLWQLGGNAPWTIDANDNYNGIYSAKSGSIGDNTVSELEIIVDIIEDGNLSFYKKVSCELPGSYSGTYYDYLTFYIDNVEIESWAGEIPWSQSTYSMIAGEHILKWVFTKDQDSSSDVNSGQDAVWIDEITFPSIFGSSNLPGDLNSDLNINIQDVIIIVNLILNNEESTGADINGDGNVDVVDIILIVNLILQD